jgi:hypothetical protein
MLAAGSASAQSIIEQPGNHASKVDVEVHGILGSRFWGNGGGWGWGAGVRVGIPLMANGPIRTINNSFNLNVGGEVLFWSDYWGRGWGGAMEFVVPVEVQWNFYLLPALSLFAEGGIAFDFSTCGAYCGFGVWPGVAVGARIHFNGRADYPALVVRAGFPVGLTLGVAF